MKKKLDIRNLASPGCCEFFARYEEITSSSTPEVGQRDICPADLRPYFTSPVHPTVTQPNCRPLESTTYAGHLTGHKWNHALQIHVSPDCRDGASETRLCCSGR